MERQRRIAQVVAAFTARFGAAPELWARAPGRVDLMGSHTDYNEGYVLTLSIDRDTWIAARRRPDRRVTVYSLDVQGGGEFSLDSITRDDSAPWTNYIRGVAYYLQEAGFALTGFDGLVQSTVPISSGLSSSAALEVATATLFRLLGGWTMDPLQMALICQRAENRFVGMNCGILDQYSSVFGRAGCALLLDCRHLTSETVPIAAGLQVVICDTRAKRELTGSEYPERRAQCEEGARIIAGFFPHVRTLRDVTLDQLAACESALSPVVARRCRFIIEENGRVLRLRQVLPAGDRAAFSALAQASYQGARDLYEIGTPEMEAMVEAITSAPGAIGGRQAGAGFGGCMVALVEGERVYDFVRHVEEHYARETGIRPDVYPVTPASGAGPLNLSG
jgi:galactokinase